MAVDITMPRLSDSMEEGAVAKWHVGVGSTVERGQVLAEIDTDKATMDYEAETGGTVLAILVQEGETAAVGAAIAVLGDPGESIAERVGQATSSSEEPSAAAPSSPTPAAARGARENASPVARRLAAELGVDLQALQGTGPGGLITKEDVQQAADVSSGAAAVSSSAKGNVRIEKLTRVQQLIARRMAEGSEVPTFAVDAEIDVSGLSALRAEYAGEHPPSLNDYVVRAAALALRDFPRLNGSFTEVGFELYSRINVGIAVASEGALLVPVVLDADTKSIAEIGAEARRLAELARTHEIGPADLEGGTFTVTNLGMFGTSRFLPIVNPPQAAILAVGAATRRPAFDDAGNVVAAELMTATLVCDHRIVYGAEGARFLGRLRELLEDPVQL